MVKKDVNLLKTVSEIYKLFAEQKFCKIESEQFVFL